MGGVYSNYQFLKIAPTVAVAVTPKLWLGGAVNIDWASLAVTPIATAAPTVDAQGISYYSGAPADGAFGFGYQVGAVYRPNDLVSLGAAYTSKQNFDPFKYNSTYANPTLPSYGTAREIEFELDVPAVLAGGLALAPLPNLNLAADLRYIFYEQTTGFDEQGFNPDGSVKGFGWKDVTVLAVGGEFWPTERFAIRAGYNHSSNPIPSEQSFFNVPAPAIVRDHYTVGLGIRPSRRFEISAAYYIAPEQSITGPIPNPSLPATSTVSSTLKESALLIQFSFWTR
jgi:long-chain fatty acid transport protein